MVVCLSYMYALSSLSPTVPCLSYSNAGVLMVPAFLAVAAKPQDVGAGAFTSAEEVQSPLEPALTPTAQGSCSPGWPFPWRSCHR